MGGEHREFNSKEIAQVIIAMIIRGLLESFLIREGPRDEVLYVVKDLGSLFEKGFQAFFKADIDGLKDSVVDVTSALDKASDLAPLCDPKLEVCSGTRTPFKSELLSTAIKSMQMLVSDLDMLILAVRRWGEAGVQTIDLGQAET